MSQLPADKDCLEAYSRAQADDPVCSQLILYCQNGWPDRHQVKGELLRYWSARTDLSVCEGLLLYGTRIVVPKKLQHKTLCKIHQGHQGIERCRLRVTTSVWWPGVSSQMETFVRQCSTCTRLHPPTKEPMLSSALPKHPWEKVAIDLFVFKGKQYLLMVDHYSRYAEVIQLTATTSASVISSMKNIFSRHGIPHTVVSDSGPSTTLQR